MSLFAKVKSSVFLCGVELSFNATAVPSAIDGWQLFYNATYLNSDFAAMYVGKSTIDFKEDGEDTKAGTSFKQKVTFRFPSTDARRAERIALMHKIKFVKLKLSNGLDIVIGRNDFDQNALPTIKSGSDGSITEISVESVSMFPSGFTPNLDTYGLPVAIPLTF